MKPFASFDVETDAPAPEGQPLSADNAPRITCAAAALQDRPEPIIWHAPIDQDIPPPPLNPRQTDTMLSELAEIARTHTLVTWNGTSFDLHLLALLTGRHEDCSSIALAHVDMMFHIFAHKGWPVSLQTLAQGMNLSGKSQDLSGRDAPDLWRQGDHRRVIEYCAQDAQATLEIAAAGAALPYLSWQSRSGRVQTLTMPAGWLTVAQAMNVPEPDTSWMTSPIPRDRFTGWLTPQQTT